MSGNMEGVVGKWREWWVRGVGGYVVCAWGWLAWRAGQVVRITAYFGVPHACTCGHHHRSRVAYPCALRWRWQRPVVEGG